MFCSDLKCHGIIQDVIGHSGSVLAEGSLDLFIEAKRIGKPKR